MGSIAVPDFDTVADKVPSPVALAHVVLRTSKIPEMSKWYQTFLGAHVVFENEVSSFLTYDHEHHRIALVHVPGVGARNPMSEGLEHIAFSFPTLNDLLIAYRQRKARGVKPVWCVNHGPTISFYYKDPEGNMLETQVDCFPTVEEANDFIATKQFQTNPYGADLDPEELIVRIKEGATWDELRKRPEVGPRELPDFDHMHT